MNFLIVIFITNITSIYYYLNYGSRNNFIKNFNRVKNIVK